MTLFTIGYRIGLAIIFSGIVYLLYQYQTGTNQMDSQQQVNREEKVFTLEISNRKLVKNTESLLSIKQGDLVTITVTADEDEEFHIHGYDKQIDLVKNKPSSLTFIANIAGTFPFELEKSKAEIGNLEVQP